MPDLRGLTIIVATADAARFHAVLSIAAASAALDRPTRLFLQADAVALLRSPVGSEDDQRYHAAGIPTLAELLEEALAMGVSVRACQSGLPLAKMEATQLPEGVETGGLIELLSGCADDQLLMA